MKNKKALSGVVTAVILIAITLAAGVIVATMTNVFVTKQLNKTASCYDIIEKVQINSEFTCYNETGDYAQVSISLGQISPAKILISLAYENESMVYSLYPEIKDVPGVTNYPDNSTGVKLPANESGQTYIVSGLTSKPDRIQVSPMMGTTQCEVIDTLSYIDSCN